VAEAIACSEAGQPKRVFPDVAAHMRASILATEWQHEVAMNTGADASHAVEVAIASSELPLGSTRGSTSGDSSHPLGSLTIGSAALLSSTGPAAFRSDTGLSDLPDPVGVGGESAAAGEGEAGDPAPSRSSAPLDAMAVVLSGAGAQPLQASMGIESVQGIPNIMIGDVPRFGSMPEIPGGPGGASGFSGAPHGVPSLADLLAGSNEPNGK